jgi:hypothetical protein
MSPLYYNIYTCLFNIKIKRNTSNNIEERIKKDHNRSSMTAMNKAKRNPETMFDDIIKW